MHIHTTNMANDFSRGEIVVSETPPLQLVFCCFLVVAWGSHYRLLCIFTVYTLIGQGRRKSINTTEKI